MKSLKITTFNYNLFYLFLCIVWAPLQLFYLRVDAAGRLVLLLSVVALVLNFKRIKKRKHIFGSWAFICWALLVLFSFANSMLQGYVSQFGLVHYIRVNFLLPFVLLVVTIIELDNDRKRCLHVLLVAFLAFMVLGVLNLSQSDDERAMVEGIGNALPLTASVCPFIAGVLFCEGKLKGGLLSFGFIVAFALVVIISAATRKALGALVLILLGVLLGQGKKKDAQSFLFLIIGLIVLFVGLHWLMGNTLIGERLFESKDEYYVQLVENPAVNDFLMKLLGDRAMMYYLGFELFTIHPIAGIGLNNFMYVSQFGYRLHSEYMVQLCENGLIGFCLLLLFYFSLFKGLNRVRQKGNNIMVYMFGLLAVLFINLTAWTYNMNNVMIIYALIIVRIYSKSFNESQ